VVPPPPLSLSGRGMPRSLGSTPLLGRLPEGEKALLQSCGAVVSQVLLKSRVSNRAWIAMMNGPAAKGREGTSTIVWRSGIPGSFEIQSERSSLDCYDNGPAARGREGTPIIVWRSGIPGSFEIQSKRSSLDCCDEWASCQRERRHSYNRVAQWYPRFFRKSESGIQLGTL